MRMFALMLFLAQMLLGEGRAEAPACSNFIRYFPTVLKAILT